MFDEEMKFALKEEIEKDRPWKSRKKIYTVLDFNLINIYWKSEVNFHL